MTRLLVSVRSAQEALAAVAGGADLVDVKEPRLGSLGSAGSQVWTEVAAAVCGIRPLSAALGELSDFIPFPANALRGYTFAKLGLAEMHREQRWCDRWHSVLANLPDWITPVAAAYVDEGPPLKEVCEVGERLGCRTLLIDTFDKLSGSVFDLMSRSALRDIFKSARDHGMLTVLAGSLRLEHLPLALAFEPDYVAVRGAVCSGSRAGRLEEALVRRWSQEFGSSRISPPFATGELKA